MHLIVLLALAQTPDPRGEVALPPPPVYRGTKAQVPIPPKYHIRNEGGSDDAGLCVISSAVINGAHQGVEDLRRGKASKLWTTAKQRPGGYWPEKLDKLIRECYPKAKWTSYYGPPNPKVLEELLGKGIPAGVTMNTGKFYNYKIIDHMVSLIHFQINKLACIVDNNDPGVYHWMPAAEFLRRWPDRIGNVWAFAWSRVPPHYAGPALPFLLIGSSLLLLAAGSTLVFGALLAIALLLVAGLWR